MRSKLFLVVALTTAIITAQTINDVPSCATTCINTAIKDSNCSVGNVQCLCAGLITSGTETTGCLKNSTCSTSDLRKITQVYNQFCTQATNTTSATSQTPTGAASVNDMSRLRIALGVLAVLGL